MAIDLQYLMLLQNFRNATGGILNAFFVNISTWGVPPLITFITMSIYWVLDKELGQSLLFGLHGCFFVNGVLKLTACVYRPWIRSSDIVPVTKASGYSFPSAHTTGATATYGTLAYHYRRQKTLFVLFLCLIFLIMFSRNYLGVHTPEDVAVGFLSSVLVIYIMYRLRMWAEKGSNRDLILFAASVVIVVLALVYFAVKSYPRDLGVDGKLVVDPAEMMPDSYLGCGGLLGMLLGWIVERRFIKFSTNSSSVVKVKRFVVGILLVVLVNTVLDKVLVGLGKNWGHFVFQFLSLFIYVAVYPAIFNKLEVSKKAV